MRIREREDIVNVLAQCELHWSVRRIPEARVDEMRDELHLHLREATRNGKPVETVVGCDVLAFAETWARENRSSWPVRQRVAEFGYTAVVMVAVFAGLLHLVRWDLEVQVRWVEAVLLLVTALSCIITATHIRGVGRPRREAGWPIVIATSLGTVGIAWGLSLLTTGERNGVLLEWPWYATLICAVVACSVVASWIRGFSREDAERERRRAGREYGSSEGV